MAKYKAYPEYKESGVEWLGELPAHWTTLAIKHVAQLNPSKSYISVEKMKGMCSFIPMEKLKFNSLCLDEIKDVTDVYNGYTYFENEDILIAKVTPCFENKNMVVAHDLNNGIGFGSSEIYVLRCNDIIDNDFLFYRLQEDNFMSIAEGAMTGAGGLKRVPSEVLNNFKFGLPSKKEQSIIVDFLDHETAKIDNLIEKQQQLIELLKEKRQAVISYAVTKGLNPDVPMKDSGVEWLGEVPEHWKVSSLGYYSSLNTGATPDRSNSKYWNGEIAWIKTGEVNYNNICSSEEKITWEAVKNTSVRLSPPGTLLMAMYGQGITRGRVAILDISATYNQACVAISPSETLLNVYLRLFFIAGYHAIRDGGNETSQMNLNADIVRKFKILVPPLSEQKEIVSYLDCHLPQIEMLVERADSVIALLQERRTALISAAVTGKIDVRDWVAPALNDAEVPQEVTA
ncbi:MULTISPECIES: restriction endonuclease subunit S [Serratia]|uniref:restriction endonuclease subunit S n=1 Tax=Serratia TaxID=613 RepID=UPI0018D9195B|nr:MULTISPECIES: restriction endonuclease subunit S [Serratia]MBH2688194.1 restriction endonuclease subunit S [Serratia ureilytica]MBZ0047482.1 restriction endonuclease subunit S [Serratia sp. EWG9]